MTKFGASLGVLAAALCVATAADAAPISIDNAFNRDRNTSVRERDKPEYDARGVRVGTFRFFPEFAASTKYDDNVFVSDAAKESDMVSSARAAAALRSDWRRHAFSFTAAAETNYHSEFAALDTVDSYVKADARLDLIEDNFIDFTLGYSDSHEDRIDTSTLTPLSEPVGVVEEEVGLALVTSFNRVRFSVGAEAQRKDYEDVRDTLGIEVDQDGRDNDLITATTRLDYAISPDTALFVEASRNWRTYDQDPAPASGLTTQDSDGYAALVGVNFDVSNVMRGEVGVGYLRQIYDDSVVKPSEGLAVDARVEWFPDELVTVAVAASRDVRESGLVGVAGRVADAASARIDYEARRNVVVGVSAAYEHSAYENDVAPDREEERWTGGVSLDFLINETADAFIQAEYVDQNSTGVAPGREFEVGRVSFGLRLRR
jgi:hypothetical protein